MARVVLITGGNIGNMAENLGLAKKMIGEQAGVVVKESQVRVSEPWGSVDDGNAGAFMNQALVIETQLPPLELLKVTQSIETRLGREKCPYPDGKHPGKRHKYKSRTMDIDILFYDDITLDSEELTIPHPMMRHREFVLAPLSEIMPGYRHPALGKTAGEMLDELKKTGG